MRAALVSLAPQAASAQGRLEAHYEASLSGIPVGKGTWAIEIGDDTFSAAAQGATAGLLKAFAGGTGSGGSQGRVVNGALVADLLHRQHQVEKIRDHPDDFGQRQRQGIFRSIRSRRSIPTASSSPRRTSAACSIP